MINRKQILENARQYALKAYKKGRLCRNKYVFKKEREIVERYYILCRREREKNGNKQPYDIWKQLAILVLGDPHG